MAKNKNHTAGKISFKEFRQKIVRQKDARMKERRKKNFLKNKVNQNEFDNADEIIAVMDTYLHLSEPIYKKWYVGITEDPYDRLIDYHQVQEKSDDYICCKASTRKIAGYVEKYFVKQQGADGNTGGGKRATSHYVYAYKIMSHTKERDKR